jgi:mono/diheme cytochrome c family protein
VGFATNGQWTFPIGTVFVKHFELPIDDTNPAVRKRLETRFLVHANDGTYYGLTYKWRADHSDADLLPGGLNEAITITTATGTRSQTWSYPSRQDCIVCHNSNAGSVLGVRTCELNGDFTYPATGVTDNQLRTLNHIGVFSSVLSEGGIPSLPRSASIHDNTASLELRVRSYLDSNCAHCHRPNGVRANFDARLETPLHSQGLIRGDVFDPLGIIDAKLIVPGDVSKSMLRHRDNLVGTNQMPPLARNVVDASYISVLSQWINSLPPDYTLPGGVFVTQIPATAGNDNDYELGMKFRASQPGIVTAIRYYRTAGKRVRTSDVCGPPAAACSAPPRSPARQAAAGRRHR